jgi:hypothetical protein
MSRLVLELIGVFVFLVGLLQLIDTIRGGAGPKSWKVYLSPVAFILIGLVIFFLGYGPIHIS